MQKITTKLLFFFYFNFLFNTGYFFGTRSKSTQSNLRTAYQSRVRVRGNKDSEK